MAFKMKAGKEGPMYKNFPGAFKVDPKKKDTRSTTKKVYDKATQIGMGILGGLKGLVKNTSGRSIDNQGKYPGSDTIKGITTAYNKEKAADEAAAMKMYKKSPKKNYMKGYAKPGSKKRK